jgi:SNF2 family DNA or RNA helicase
MTKRVKLYKFQEEGIDIAVDRLLNGQIDDKKTHAFLLCDEMGLGKTVQAFGIRKRLNLSGPTLVVAPSSCQHIWTSKEYEADVDVRIFTNSPSTILNMTGNTLVVTSYDTIRNAYKYYISEKLDQGALSNDELIKLCLIHGKSVERTKLLSGDGLRKELLSISRTIKHKDSKKTNLVCSAFMKQEWSLLILDEVHKTRSIQSSVTKAISFMNARYRLALSGTPIMNYGSDLMCIWKYALCLFDLNWETLTKCPDSDYCKNVIDTISLGRKKSDLDELVNVLPKRDKSKEHVIIPWDSYDEQRALYVDVKSDTLEILKSLKDKKKELRMIFLAKIQLLRQICLHVDLPTYMGEGNGPNKRMAKMWNPAIHSSFTNWNKRCIFTILLSLRRTNLYPIRQLIIKHFISLDSLMIQPSPKMVYVYEELLKCEKMVVFCTFKMFFQYIMQPWLDQIGYESLIFCGGNRKKQQETLKEFKKSKHIKVLLIVKSAGSEGLNMQFDSNVCIIMDPHFNLAVDEQAAQRIDRIGQEKEVIVRRLFMEGSIDEAMNLMQKEKQTNIDAWSGKGNAARSIQIQGLFLSKKDTV